MSPGESSANTGMSVLEALRECAPLVGEAAVDERREVAARRLLEELRRMAQRLRAGRDDVEDAISETLLRLATGRRRSEPREERGALAYLGRALRNNFISVLRRRGKEVSIDDVPPLIDLTSDPAEAFDRKTEERERRVAEEVLDRDVVDAVAGRLSASDAEGFRKALGDLRKVASGEIMISDLVAAEASAEPGDEGVKRSSRNRIDKRFQRVREKLHDAARRLERSAKISDRCFELVLESIDRLRVRGAGT